jgi:hypothetical protein
VVPAHLDALDPLVEAAEKAALEDEKSRFGLT